MSRLPLLVVASVIFTAVAAVKEPRTYVLPLQDSIPAFIDAISVGSGIPAFHYHRTNRLAVLKSTREALEVRDAAGRTGWVERKLTAKMRGSKYTFDNAYVITDFEQPDPAFILDTDDPAAAMIRLNRSFSERLRDNIDRPTGKRITGQGPDRREYY